MPLRGGRRVQANGVAPLDVWGAAPALMWRVDTRFPQWKAWRYEEQQTLTTAHPNALRTMIDTRAVERNLNPEFPVRLVGLVDREDLQSPRAGCLHRAQLAQRELLALCHARGAPKPTRLPAGLVAPRA